MTIKQDYSCGVIPLRVVRSTPAEALTASEDSTGAATHTHKSTHKKTSASKNPAMDGVREFLLVQHNAGHWAFPKGHPEGDETPIETARRELLEETGLADVELVESPAFEEYYEFTKRSGTVVQKRVTYYLGWLRDPPAGAEDHAGGHAGGGVRLQAEEVQAFAWGDAAATAARLSFDEGRALLDEVVAHLEGLG